MKTETENIDRLFLELSQFTKAKTRRELKLFAVIGDMGKVLRDIQREVVLPLGLVRKIDRVIDAASEAQSDQPSSR